MSNSANNTYDTKGGSIDADRPTLFAQYNRGTNTLLANLLLVSFFGFVCVFCVCVCVRESVCFVCAGFPYRVYVPHYCV